MSHWPDADVFIQSKNKMYKFGQVPQFWGFLSAQLEAGTIKVPKMVYDELTAGIDELSNWCKTRKSSGMRVLSNSKVQDCYSQIANYVMAKYEIQHSKEFLRGGDGWVIAHAMAEGGTVVTQESENTKKKKVKVPTVCRNLGVRCIDTFQMLDELDFKIP